MFIHDNKPIGKTGTLPSGRPSNHAITKASLEQRKINFSREDRDALDFDAVWKDCFEQHMPTSSSDYLKQQLTNAIKGSYKSEEEFDLALFDALGVGLSSSVMTETIKTKRKVNGKLVERSRNVLAIKSLKWEEKDSKDWSHECAIAFTTQVTNNGDLSILQDFVCASSARHDHSCVVIARKNKKKDGSGEYDNWKVRESFASVELKRQKESIPLQKTSQKRRKKDGSGVYTVETIDSPLGHTGFGELWQAIAYTISDVWTCLARRGAGTQQTGGEGIIKPPTHIPFGILACAITGEQGREHDSRYAYGSVVIPEDCGGRFSFNLLSSETFDMGIVNESANEAAAAYIKVFSFGVSMGSSIKGRALPIGKVHSMVGRKLHLLDQDITESFTLFRSPVSTNKFGVAASQGEIWQGSLGGSGNVQGRDRLKFTDIDFAGSSLLLKCSSNMVHNPLVGSNENWSALGTIVDKQVTESVNRVLIYAEKSKHESIKMLMHDLSNTHQDLLPFQHKHQLGKLWGRFCTLVKNTLLPLATVGIVHPDIRPGYDFTSNILLHVPADENMDEGDMALIDLDSLTDFETCSDIDFPGYLGTAGLNPYSYVWWQCFVVAVMWKQERTQEVGCRPLQSTFELIFDASTCAASHVQRLLTTVSESDWFDGQDLTDERAASILGAFLFPV